MPEPPGRVWRESWPPTKMHLTLPRNPQNANNLAMDKEDNHDLSLVDDNPLSYFLTPALSEEDETDYSTDDFDDDGSDEYMDFELDAGIEGASHLGPGIRSVSPSFLDRYTLPRLRPPTPPRLSFADSNAKRGADEDDVVLDFPPGLHNDIATPYPEDEAGELWEQSPPQLCFPTPSTDSSVGSPSSASQTFSSSRPQLHHAANGSGRQGIMITRHRSPRSWREPSPEVFSIEEETEQQLEDSDLLEVGSMELMGIRPKKHVRFVLPDRDMA